jgi:hypothetical protein
MENASRTFLDTVRKTMRQIRTAIGATTINPELLTAAERLQYEGYQLREEVNTAILALGDPRTGEGQGADQRDRASPRSRPATCSPGYSGRAAGHLSHSAELRAPVSEVRKWQHQAGLSFLSVRSRVQVLICSWAIASRPISPPRGASK